MSELDKVQSLSLDAVLRLPESIAEGQLAAFQLGPKGRIWLAWNRRQGLMRILRVVALDEQGIHLDVEIKAPPFETHLVQPLGDDILVACSRCGCCGSEPQCVAAVYDRKGELLRMIDLGEGIANLQTGADGSIWTGYLAEGEFAQLPWTRPLEQPGLVRWSREGKRLECFDGGAELERLDDCYALNVVGDEDLWFLHFPRFCLVHLVGGTVTGVWDLPLAGGCTVAVSGDVALVKSDAGDIDTFQVMALKSDGDYGELGAVRFVDAEGRSLDGARVSARGGNLALLKGKEIFRYDARFAAMALALT